MIRFTLFLIGTVGVLNIVSASTNENVTIEEIYDMAQNILNATDEWQEELKSASVEGRKSKLLPFGGGLLPFHALCEYLFSNNRVTFIAYIIHPNGNFLGQ